MSPEERGGKLEEQPFLSDDAQAAEEDRSEVTDLSLSTEKEWWRPAAWSLSSWAIVAIILAAVATTALGLSAVTANAGADAGAEFLAEATPAATAVSSPSSFPSTSSATENPSQPTTQSEKTIQHSDDIPGSPTLRDASAYVLDPGWDVEASPAMREFHWTITDAVLNPDGVYRPMMLINNQYPGPLVECNKGDRIVVHVHNRATNATAIHFHGLYQNGTNAMDGTVGVTQCAIAPNSSFTYDFRIRDQAGTYWYHAHHSAQASDGLLGPVVIHSADERATDSEAASHYDTDRVVMVQDHYHNTTSELLMEYLKPDMENDEPVPDNALINGRGVRSCDDFAGWPCDASNATTPVMDLVKGQRHRLRVINVGAFAEFQIQFDEHPFYVTEVDGTDVRPEPFHRLNILPAQRYSVVIEANSTSADAFWMRARMVTHCFTTENPRLVPEIRAIVRYVSADAQQGLPRPAEPQSKEWPEAIEVICRDLNTTLLEPAHPQTPPPADDYINLRAQFMIGNWALARGFFNDSTWHHNATHPSLHRFLGSGDGPSSYDAPTPGLYTNDRDFDPSNDLVMQTTGVRTVDISINNFDDGSHPFHLHGHKFYVLLQGTSGYPPAPEDLQHVLESGGHLRNPLRRDTITVEGYAWAVIRVVFDNPGMWAFHCHNAWHAESGMVMQFLVRGEVVKGWPLDKEMVEMCSRPGVDKGMRPSDSLWFGWL